MRKPVASGEMRHNFLTERGREAAPLRKALLAIVLVAASFAGGAVVNGPGLRWAQAMILNRLSGDGGEDAAPDDAAQVKEDAIPLEPIPANPVPPLALGTDEGTPAKSGGKSQGKAQDPGKGKAAAKEPAGDAASPLAAPLPPLGLLADGTAPLEPKAPAPPESKEDDPGDAPAAAGSRNDAQILLAKAPGAESSGPEPPDLMPSPLPAPADTRADAPRVQPQAQPQVPGSPSPSASAPGQVENWADAPGSAPAAAVPPRGFEPSRPVSAPAEAGTTPTPTLEPSPAPASATGWAEIRRKMSALGVSRYRIEGEPGGRVRFSCIIPLAGRRAVAQHFEAEGDDELQAAETALRRVDLWRATETPGPTP